MPANKTNTSILFQSYLSLTIFYFAVLLLDMPWMVIILKPIPVLLLAYFTSQETEPGIYVFLGLVASLGGDTALAFGDEFFVVGLASFLIAHGVYARGFWLIKRSTPLISYFPFFIYILIFCIVINPYTGEIQVPVIMYAVTISVMIWRAFGLRGFKKYRVVFWGALLFVISDTILAFNRFYFSWEYAPFAIMPLYWAGQYLIFKPFQK